MQCTRKFSKCPEGIILGYGDPLLDMRVEVFATNLAASFILNQFRDEFLKILPYVDILFGDEKEGKAFADKNN
uniref:Adenosine kinase n=1 Tax=Onchocerca volvulus TaxID=6282 RepID=A0A8R1Y0A8_ONCVO